MTVEVIVSKESVLEWLRFPQEWDLVDVKWKGSDDLIFILEGTRGSGPPIADEKAASVTPLDGAFSPLDSGKA